MIPSRIIYQLNCAYQAVSRSIDQTLRSSHDLSLPQQGILFILTGQKDMPISRLAEVMRMSKSSLTGLVDRLEQNGMVQRQSSAMDGRSTLVALTPKGIAIVAKTGPITRAINQALLEPFTEEEQQVISRFLKHAEDNATFIVAREAAKGASGDVERIAYRSEA